MATPADTGNTAEARRHTFPRRHRLKRRRLIRALFDRSRGDVGTVAAGVVRLVFRVVRPEEAGARVPIQIGFAPGRCRTAVARNRVRRLLREHYRTHQHLLTDLFRDRPGAVLTMMAIFRGNPARPGPIRRDLPRAMREAAQHRSLRTPDR